MYPEFTDLGSQVLESPHNQTNSKEAQFRFDLKPANWDLYIDAIQVLHLLLKNDAILCDAFTSTPNLLRSFNLTRLILSDEAAEVALGLDFGLLLFRFDKYTTLSDLTSDSQAYELL